MAKNTGLSVFENHQESSNNYVDRFKIYCTVNDVTEAKKASAFLNMMGAQTYSLLTNLVAPKKPSELTFMEVVASLRKHLNPAPLIITERFKFHRRHQS